MIFSLVIYLTSICSAHDGQISRISSRVSQRDLSDLLIEGSLIF